jgi:hypothetical protein
VGFLGKSRRFLIPHELLKPISGLMGGLVGGLFIRSLIHSSIGLLVHGFFSFSHSFIHPVLTYQSLIHPHPHHG